MSSISEYLGVSAVESVTKALDLAKQSDKYNIFLHLCEERALERAKKVDAGELSGKLAGVPFAVKDNYLAFDGPTTAASYYLKDFVSPLQATAIEKLEAEGAICIGKTNLDAFAHGGSTENSYFGLTLNARSDERVAGGSSGGSAVAVALGIVPFALGTDTGGSIREPASFNGVVGFKPTYGTVSRFGVVAMASSTDVLGVFSDTIADSELVLGIMSGKDEKDMTSLDDFFEPIDDSKPNQKVALIKEFVDEGVDEEVKSVLMSYVNKLKLAGHTVEEVSMPILKYTLAMYYVIVPAEISSNLARYDGIRYGARNAEAKSLKDVYGMSRDEGFVDENKRRIMIGSFVLSSGYFDAYYLKAQKARTLLVNEFDKLFESYDMLIGPVAPTPAFRLGENTDDPIKMYLADIMTVPASLAGLPALSVPAGKSTAGLDIGVQLIAPRKSDAKLLAFAKTMEENT